MSSKRFMTRLVWWLTRWVRLAPIFVILSLLFSTHQVSFAHSMLNQPDIPPGVILSASFVEGDDQICKDVDYEIEVFVQAAVPKPDTLTGKVRTIQTFPPNYVISVKQQGQRGTASPVHPETGGEKPLSGGGVTKSAIFLYKATEVGEETIIFASTVTDPATGKEVERQRPLNFTVEECNLNLDAISEWKVPGPANIRIVATIDKAEMRADDQGHFTGTGVVNWVASVGRVEDCGGTIDIGSSQVELTGDRGGSKQVAVQMNFQPATVEFNIDCGEGVGGTRQETATPDSLAFNIPSTGGTLIQTQGLSGPGVSTSTTIHIFPQEDQAAASGPHLQMASVHSLWMWWEFVGWYIEA